VRGAAATKKCEASHDVNTSIVECEADCKAPAPESYHCSNVTHVCEKKKDTLGHTEAKCAKICKPK
jgi:hypothetical protein